MFTERTERLVRRGLIAAALAGLALGLAASFAGRSTAAQWLWAAGTLPVVIALLLSADPIRGLAVMVAATPCPLILAAPAAFIAGVSQAARRGILIKGGGPLEALAHTHTVMFDKTGTLTVGGARLVAVEAAPGEKR